MKGAPRLGTQKPQISPLRFASVEMTKLGVVANPAFLNPIFIIKRWWQARLCPSFCHSRRESAFAPLHSRRSRKTRSRFPAGMTEREASANTEERLGAPYLARSLRQMWETADLCTSLRSGRDDKVRCSCQPRLFSIQFSSSSVGGRPVFAFLSVIPAGNLLSRLFIPVVPERPEADSLRE